MEKEEKIIGEQPLENTLALNAEEQHDDEENFEGSPISKFKSVEALKTAYQNLEKEFTQKCQKIKELTDKLSSMDNAHNAPEYESENWAENVKEFFASHPMAKEYAKEISQVLSNNEQIANSKNSLENALTKVLADKFVPYDKLAEDDKFLEKYIYQNKKISDKIINQYLDSLSKSKALPLITSTSGMGTFSSPTKKPKTIRDAGKMVEAYFKN